MRESGFRHMSDSQVRYIVSFVFERSLAKVGPEREREREITLALP